MTNTEELKVKIKKSGISITFIARKLGISREYFYKKMNNEADFKASEILAIARILGLNKKERDAIFFAEIGELYSTS